MSCAAPGECAASGYYTDADGVQGFVVTQTEGVWGDALPVPGLKALNVGDTPLPIRCRVLRRVSVLPPAPTQTPTAPRGLW